VIFASLTLALLLFLMSGTGGFFTKRIALISYFDNASGLRQGAPVRLSGVDIGNVVAIRVVPDKDKQITPVEVVMKVSTKYGFNLRRDSVTSLDTAGVLGETYLDIDSSQAIGVLAKDGDTLPTQVHPDFNEVVRSSQSTLQNMDALLKRADRILAFAESGKGSLGKLIYDPVLYDRLSQTVTEFKGVVDEIAQGQGSLGKLINNNDAYNKFVATLDKINAVADDLQAGKGTAGKFLKDPALYNNANDTIANLKKVSEDINAGKVTFPVAKAMSRLGGEQRKCLWETVKSKPAENKVVEQVIELLEKSGALSASVDHAKHVVESAWAELDSYLDESFYKLLLRAFGLYVLDRHY